MIISLPFFYHLLRIMFFLFILFVGFFSAVLPFITIEWPWNLYFHFKIHLSSLCFIDSCGGFNTPKIQKFSHLMKTVLF